MKKILLLYLISTLFFLIIYPSSDNQKYVDSDKSPLMFSIYRTETGTISKVPMETYVTYVVASEMPSSFHIEALKAQAVAARTYAVSKSEAISNPAEHPLAPLCDSTHCQVYKDASQLPVSVDLDKIKEAVNETASELMYYDGELVENAVYHASSGGTTENSEDVFVTAVPYLKSVDSPYEESISRNGHGVGMSQQGANGMAKHGYSYKKILSHYYSGTVVY